jgi:outer membrane protein assembly factor BamB
LILTLLAAALVGCRSSHPSTPKVDLIPPGSFAKAWEAETTLKSVKAFYLAGDTLFLYGPDGLVAGFDRGGGLQFRAMVGQKGDVLGPPMVNAERVVIPTSSALEVTTPNGTRLRTVHTPQPLRSPGVMNNDIVYAGTDSNTGGRLAAISLSKPPDVTPIIWTRLSEHGSIINTAPVLFENTIYAAAEAGSVFALTTGQVLLWPRSDEMPEGIFHVDGKIFAPIKVDESGVYIPCSDSKLYCLVPNTGKIRWTYYAGIPLTDSPVLSSEMLYMQVKNKGMVAIEKKAGGSASREPRWANADAKKVLADDAKYTYVLTHDGHIAALDKQSGKRSFTSANGDYADGVSNMNPKDNTIFVLTKSGMLKAIKPVLKAGVVGELAMVDFN